MVKTGILWSVGKNLVLRRVVKTGVLGSVGKHLGLWRVVKTGVLWRVVLWYIILISAILLNNSDSFSFSFF